ncbi:hypothetical protein GCM10023221_04380 [Luteimicrobium xylanilyticum]|uniref:Uncharacterized protein n=1 Tax=Luteimicrobium xylanilyticum TaxID=1133546 RepID=A0A5P9Q7C3_9MICO|nr:hypothetical protein [Luteimicrobium xylanilyticum]QFU97269.1 hypothetical protein KDY119_00763 [Luteimicrobium xylanilyticum]
MRRPGHLLPFGQPVGTQLWSAKHPSRKMHAVGCAIDGGPGTHGLRGFRCHRCSEQVEDRIEAMLGRLDKRG